MLCRVGLFTTDVSGERIISIIRATRIGELGTTLAVRRILQLLVTDNVVLSSPILVTIMMEAIRSSETSALTRAIQHSIPENGIFETYFNPQ
jgi:hypothetical protein